LKQNQQKARYERANRKDTHMKNIGKKARNPEEKAIVRMELDELVRRGAQELLAKALEIEVDLFIEKYQYVLDDEGNRRVVKNGHQRPREILTGAGPVEVAVPRVDDRALITQNEPQYTSGIVPKYLRKSNNVDELLPVLYLKGISTGDFQEALEKILGPNAKGLSAQTIVRLKRVWQEEYKEWCARRLDDVEYVYWWVDGVHFNVRLGEDKRMCVLVIIGARKDGVKEIVAVADGFRESKTSWASVLRDLRRQGLKAGPKLAVGDGALGFWAAMNEELGESDQQLCWVHKTANILDKLPDSLQGKAKTMIHNIYMAPTKKEANIAFDIFIEEFEARYLRAVDCLRNNRERLMTFYNYPAQHWAHIRSTNPIESTFATVRLRTHKTKGCGNMTATLTMVFKLLQSASRRWQRLHSHQKVADVWAGIKFEDGIRVEEILDGKMNAEV
jgi:transposase-like protein